MSKRFAAALGGFALVIGLVVPVTSAGAQSVPAPAIPSNGKVLGKSDTGSYVVVMAADPLVKSIARDQLDSPPARAEASAIEATHEAVLRDAGLSTDDKIHDYTNALNGFSAVLDYDEALTVAADPNVVLVMPDEMRHAQTDSSPGFLGLDQPGGAWNSGLTGEGVVVGVIDSGIWPEHPSFADDGTFPAPAPLDATVRSACDFGNVAANPDDAAFTCNNKLIGARQMLDTYRALVPTEPGEFDSARDDEGHGTHTASTAAGDAGVQAQIFGVDRGTISGIAPRAQIIAYKALGRQGGFESDLAAAIDQAVADGVGVINFSIGGGASTLSPDTVAFLFAADAGVFSAVSAGNDGPGPATVGGPADVPWVTAVGANTQRRFFSGKVALAGRPMLNIQGATVTLGTDPLPLVDAAAAGGDLCLDGTLDPAIVTDTIVLCRRGGNGRAEKSQAVFNAGGKGMILYNNNDDDNLFTDNHFVPTVHINFTDGMKVKTYLAVTAEPVATIVPGPNTESPNAPQMTIFSSRGPNPTAADIIRPDITAPGLQILAGNTPLSDPTTGVTGQLFQAISGTSMSGPHIAGVYALVKQAHPDWTAAMAKSAIMTTANTDVRDSDRVSPADPFAMGAGQVDPGIVADPGSAFNPGLVYNAGMLDYLGFLCDEGPGIFLDPQATCPLISAAGTPIDAVDLNYPSIGAASVTGTQTVTRRVTSVADATVTWQPQITAPDGYTVTVAPAQLTLAPGQTASYTLTITNDDAPVGEWRFGDITWTGSGYSARSPIAVQGLPLDAPDEVHGTGTSGSLAFDVRFGYNGPYTAAPHGLVPETATTGDIDQDPDQTYPSPDDGAGGVDTIPFTIEGAEFVRWRLVIPGDDDIDLYLLDSAGNLVAQSTNGGTDETIDLERPVDDTYTMVIHGWAVPNAPLPYSLSSWVVPEESGGSLTVDEAPDAAVSSTSATITVGWSGLEPATAYLGAVSHEDGDGTIGLTVVSVDT